MNIFYKLSEVVDLINEKIGRSAIWITLLVAVISAGNAIVRYAFSWSSNALLEIQWYLFSAIFLLCGGYVFLKNEHIRIDIIFSKLSKKAQSYIDIFGIILFLMPVISILLYFSWFAFMTAWQTNEVSSNAGGLIRWPVRALLPVGCFLLLMQSFSELIKRIRFLLEYDNFNSKNSY